MNPAQRELGEKYVQEGGEGEVDFQGTPGWDLIQAQEDAKRRASFPIGPMPKKEAAKEKTVRIGASGFEPIPEKSPTEKMKSYFAGRILQKEIDQIPLNKGEEGWMRKWMIGSDNAKDGPKSIGEWEKVFKFAENIKKGEKIKARMAEMKALTGEEKMFPEQMQEEVELMKKAPLPFAETVSGVARVLSNVYDEMPPEKVAELTEKWAGKNEKKYVEELGQLLPDHIKHPKDAFKWLIDPAGDGSEPGISPASAKQWILDRVKE